MVSRGVGLVAVLAPFVLLTVLSVECWHLRSLGRECKTEGIFKETIQAVTTAAFAWLATPPP